MRKLAEKRGVRAVAAVLFLVFLLVGAGATAAVEYGRYDGWYHMAAADFTQTDACRTYVALASEYVCQNVNWTGDLDQTGLGSYAGAGFSYVIRNGNGRITADTRTEKSAFVQTCKSVLSEPLLQGDNEYNRTMEYTVDGYVNLPVQPFEGCYSEYAIFTALFGLRYFMIALKVLGILLSALAAGILILGAARRGRVGRLPRILQKPCDAVLCADILAALMLREGMDRIWKWCVQVLIRYIGTYPDRLYLLFSAAFGFVVTGLALAFGLWYIAGQMGAGILRRRLITGRLLARIPQWLIIIAGAGAHAALIYRALYDMAVRNWLIIIDVFLAALLIDFVRQGQTVRRSSSALAAGDLEHKTDIQRLHFIWKLLGRDLNSIGDGMAQAVEDRLKSERMKTELITNVSHDLKTPLTSIINYVDLLKSGGLDEATRAEYLDILDRQSAKLKKLTEDVVAASKAASGAMTVEREPIDAVELLEQFLGEYSERFKQADITPVVALPGKETPILGDSAHLGRVIENLITNIIKYAQPGTRAYFDLTEDENGVYITAKNVSRAALNISADELMERFVRGDSSRHSEGSGLGLSIAKSLAELMGGRLTLVLDGDLFKAELALEGANKNEEKAEKNAVT